MFRHMFGGTIGGTLVAVAALTAGGCATAESTFQDQRSWFSDPNIVDSNIVACGAGILLGGGLCAGLVALGVDALICLPLVLAGCGAAVAANEYSQYLLQKYDQREDALRDVIGRIREDNQHAAELVATSQQIISEDLQRIEELEKAKAPGQLSLDEKQREVQSLDARLAQLQDVLSGMDKKVAMYQYVSTNTYPEAGPEIQQLIEKQNGLKGLLQELLRRRNVFAAG